MEGYIMTKAIIKNLRYKYILIYCSMVLVITFLVEVENIDKIDLMRSDYFWEDFQIIGLY